jgi:hypothetical protein
MRVDSTDMEDKKDGMDAQTDADLSTMPMRSTTSIF